MPIEWHQEIEGPLLEGEGEEILFRLAERAVADIAGMLRAEVEARAPGGVTGALRGSIRSEVRGGSVEELQGEVFSLSPYAAAAEEGRAPGGFPPWRPGTPLHAWVRRRTGAPDREAGRVSFLVARAIARRGMPGRHMFRGALEASQGRIEERARRLGEEIAAALGGEGLS
ncbi:MAG: HK97 gp10 family phage protein [Candidatus Tectomicrobia bacterium]|uniref:HK97 gp10 family phage protein n=1 Tax=Tectimicrobiota bacterium TaxID=2528274 RepID=A0A932MQA1_UNCTE|nr:HK97 gp10 family phage protein [Candidatus Tectomicrobia bacterium]